MLVLSLSDPIIIYTCYTVRFTMFYISDFKLRSIEIAHFPRYSTDQGLSVSQHVVSTIVRSMNKEQLLSHSQKIEPKIHPLFETHWCPVNIRRSDGTEV